MMRRSATCMILGAVGLALGGCDLLITKRSYRFKMVVEYTTGREIRYKQAVYEVIAQAGSFKLGDTTGNAVGIVGEALEIDSVLGAVFVLLSLPKAGGGLASFATIALAPDAVGEGTKFVDAVRRLGSESAGIAAELPRRHWPMMVRFADPGDPRTVESVDSGLVGITRIILQTTNEPVTTGIQSRLPWLVRPGHRLADDGRTSVTRESPLYMRLGQGMFRAGTW